MSTKWKKEFLPEHCIVSVEIYDPVANSWSKGPDLPNALCGAGRTIQDEHKQLFGIPTTYPRWKILNKDDDS